MGLFPCILRASSRRLRSLRLRAAYARRPAGFREDRILKNASKAITSKGLRLQDENHLSEMATRGKRLGLAGVAPSRSMRLVLTAA